MMNADFSTQMVHSKRPVSAAPLNPIFETLQRSGQSLDPLTRRDMESRFDHDFSRVRVHSGPGAATAAGGIGANAFTWDRHIVFNTGRYAPHTREGQRLLAHELAHVVQQSVSAVGSEQSQAEPEARTAAAQVMTGDKATINTGVESGAIQRDDGAEDDRDRRFRLRMPRLGESLGTPGSGLGGSSQYQLHLDPAIQAQIRAIQMVQGQLSLESLQAGVSQIGSSLPSPGDAAAPDLSPRAVAQSAVGSAPTRPNPFSVPATPQRRPLVPAGRGPATPRPATVGDVLHATLRIPAVQTLVTRLQEEAGRQVRHNWNSLSTGERALVITQGVVLGAGALTGIALSPQARQFALDQVQGRDIPIPGLPVTFQFNLTGRDQRVTIGVNVGRLLPSSLGFR